MRCLYTEFIITKLLNLLIGVWLVYFCCEGNEFYTLLGVVTIEFNIFYFIGD